MTYFDPFDPDLDQELSEYLRNLEQYRIEFDNQFNDFEYMKAHFFDAYNCEYENANATTDYANIGVIAHNAQSKWNQSLVFYQEQKGKLIKNAREDFYEAIDHMKHAGTHEKWQKTLRSIFVFDNSEIEQKLFDWKSSNSTKFQEKLDGLSAHTTQQFESTRLAEAHQKELALIQLAIAEANAKSLGGEHDASLPPEKSMTELLNTFGGIDE